MSEDNLSVALTHPGEPSTPMSGLDATLIADTAAPRPGAEHHQIGRYKVLGRLGSGGMGVVYAAYDPELDRQIALKVLLHEGQPEAIARLQREAQALASLAHPNVVAVHDVGRDASGRLFIAMEYVRGSTLTAWLHDNGAKLGEPTRWRPILDLFCAAGEGLVAAHEVDLVHRDFKPENVLLGADRRPRVADFGIVTRARDSAEATEPRLDPEGRASLDVAMTRTGVLMGTPAYMAPEQFQNRPSDARTDQFSFCAALYEALYGQRPFAGDSVVGLAASVLDGALQEPPASAKVPRRIARALERGLEVDPERRWPSMRALLDFLGRDPWRARRRWAAGLTALCLTGVVSAAVALKVDEGPPPCDTRPLAGVWDGERQAAVKRAFTAVGGSNNAGTWERARAALDRRAEAWSALYQEACSSPQSTPPAERHERLECLDNRRRELQTIAEILGDAGPREVENAIFAINALTDVDVCRDLELARAIAPPPDDDGQAAAVAKLRASLAALEIRQRAGQYTLALEALTSLRGPVHAAKFAPLRAEYSLQESRLLTAVDRHDEGFKAATASWHHALRSGHDLVGVKALIELGTIGASEFHLVQEAEVRLTDAESYLDRLHGIPAPQRDHLRAALAEAWGTLRLRESRLDPARDAFQEALEILRAHHEPTALLLARPYGSLAAVELQAGKLDLSRRLFMQAMAIRSEHLGPRHPSIGGLHNNLAVLERNAARTEGQTAYQRAVEHNVKALEIILEAHGPASQRVIMARRNLGLTLLSAHRFAEAIEVFAEQRAELTEHTPNALAELLDTRVRVAPAYSQLGRHDEIYGPLADDFARFRERSPEDIDVSARALEVLARLAYAERDLDQAEDYVRASLAMHRRLEDPPRILAAVELNLANILWDKGARAEAIAAAMRGEEEAKLDLKGEPTREQLTRWLDEHADGAGRRTITTSRGGG